MQKVRVDTSILRDEGELERTEKETNPGIVLPGDRLRSIKNDDR